MVYHLRLVGFEEKYGSKGRELSNLNIFLHIFYIIIVCIIYHLLYYIFCFKLAGGKEIVEQQHLLRYQTTKMMQMEILTRLPTLKVIFISI